ncbi:MAG: GNVR domain-containing protein [Gemmatimonadaceae bacterium]
MEPAEQAMSVDHLTFTRWLSGVLLRWRLIVAITVLSVIVAIAASFIVPPVYRARSSFVANTSSASKLPSGASSASGVGGLISQLGGSLGGDPSESPNFYIQLFESRELLTRLSLSRFPNPRTEAPNDSATLIDILKIKKDDQRLKMELALKKLSKAISAGFDVKTNLVALTVDMQWPELSSQVANRLVEEVTDFNRETRVSRAKSKRLFLEARHDSAQLLLRVAEDRQRFFYEQNRGILTSPSLRAEDARIKRDVDLASDLYLTLQRQLEAARLDEINDAALITVIDSAIPPRKAQWPRYGALLVSSVALGLLIGFLTAGSLAVLADWRARNPDSWSDFENSFGRRRPPGDSALGVRRAG